MVDKKDLDMIGEIFITPKKIREITSNKNISIHFSLDHDMYNDVLVFASTNPMDLKQFGERISVKKFTQFTEEVVENIMKNGTSQLLEDHVEFKAILNKLINDVLENLNKNEREYYIASKKFSERDGLGIITHKYKNEDVGTFESISLSYNDGLLTLQANHLNGYSQLNDSYQYEDCKFTYYSLNKGKVFEFDAPKSHNYFEEDKDLFCINLKDPKVNVFLLNKANERYSLLQEQLKQKEILPSGNDLDNTSYENFRKKRLDVLSVFKEKQRKDAIYQEFADIEL